MALSLNSDKIRPINILYDKHEKLRYAFWMSLGVRYNTIAEYSPATVNQQIRLMFDDYSVQQLNELLELCDESNCDNAASGISIICQLDDSAHRELLMLRDFTMHRRKVIASYFDQSSLSHLNATTTIAQLLALFKDSPTHLPQIFTQHAWQNRSTGDLYKFSGHQLKMSEARILLSKTGEVALIDKLYQSSGKRNLFRIFSYFANEDTLQLLLYKQVYDGPLPDFEEAIRNKAVHVLMFELNSALNTLEIRSQTQFERNAILEHLEKEYSGKLERQDPTPFREYDAQKVGAVMRGEVESITETKQPDESVEPLIINKVIFSGSLLAGAPEISLELPSQDVWTAVRDAHDRECISFESLKDLRELHFKTGKTKRTIKTNILMPSGNVYLTFDDSRMDQTVRERIERQFLERFGFPLFRTIANDRFSLGRADKFNFAMRQSHRVDDVSQDVYDELLAAGYLVEEIRRELHCTNPSCVFCTTETKTSPKITRCPECDHEIHEVSEMGFRVRLESCQKSVVNALKTLESTRSWTLTGESKLKIRGKQYSFLVLSTHEGEPMRVLVSDRTIPRQVTEYIQRVLTPTICVMVGKQNLKAYNTECMYGISFGDVIARNSDELYRLIDGAWRTIQLREKNYLASAANKSHLNIQSVLSDPSNVPENYDKEFEHDIYGLIKDMFPNAAKWGSEMSGKEFPEGLFTLSYAPNPGDPYLNFAFSYDCKFHYPASTSQYFDFDTDRKVQVKKYVDLLNGSMYIPRFCHDRHLTGHIIIGNKMKPGTQKSLSKYLHEHNVSATAVVFPVDAFVHLHHRYRQNYSTLQRSRNVFLRLLHELFIQDNGEITNAQIDRVIDEASSHEAADEKALNMRKLNDRLDQ